MAGAGVLYLIANSMGLISHERPGGSGGSGGSTGSSGGNVGVQEGSGYSVYNAPGFSSSTTQRNRFVTALKSKHGKPYGWGARGPNLFDCSGFVDWGYGTLGIDVPPTVTTQFDSAPYSVTFETAHRLNDVMGLVKKGDCIGLDYEWGGKFSHVIVYLGGGKFIHASGKESCPCAGSRCKVVKDPQSHFTGVNVRGIYSWV